MRIPLKFLAFAGAALCLATPGHAVLGLFDKEEKRAPGENELQAQEAAARQMFDTAREYSSLGRHEKARETYEKLVKSYPLTSLAAPAAFEVGREREAEGDALKAFEAYQSFIATYKQSDLFAEAVKRQFEIAQRSMNGKSASFLGMKVKTQNSRNIEMFQQVAANAPFSKFAPLSHFSIGNLHMQASDEAKAVASFQKVVDDYGDTPYAAEARIAIAEIRKGQVGEDGQAVTAAVLAITDVVVNHPDHPKADEARAEIGEFEDKEQKKNFNIGRFYESKGNLRAAAIYYQQIREDGQGPTGTYAAARARLDAIREVDPNLVVPANSRPLKIEAPVKTTDNPDYLGPPPPRLTEAAKPKMRASDDDLLPVPPPEGE